MESFWSWKLQLKLTLTLIVAIDGQTVQASTEDLADGASTRYTAIDPCSVQCKDIEGNDIPWFLIYKLPQISAADNPTIQAGLAYTYLTPTKSTWTLANDGVDGSKSMPAMTLDPVFYNSANTISVAYNDQPPDSTSSSSGGHMKGMIFCNVCRCVWFYHSVPNYVNCSKSDYSYPSSGARNGQVICCMSVTKEAAEVNVTQALYKAKARVYNSSFPEHLIEMYPRLYEWVTTNNLATVSDDSAVLTLNVPELSPITMFVKSPSDNIDVYTAWIAPRLECALIVQSWRSGSGALPSNCSMSWHVQNVLNVTMQDYVYSTHKDHSKWCVGVGDGCDWICISDLNRQQSQERRGGITFCLRNSVIWYNLWQAISLIQDCPESTAAAEPSYQYHPGDDLWTKLLAGT